MLVIFHYCNYIPKQMNLKGERWVLIHHTRSFSYAQLVPWLWIFVKENVLSIGTCGDR